MDVEEIREYCMSLKGSTEDLKWTNNLVFSVGNKMYCLVSLDDVPVRCSVKVSDEVYNELIGLTQFIPAPYLARNKWITITDTHSVPRMEIQSLIHQSRELVVQKLPVKIKREIGL